MSLKTICKGTSCEGCTCHNHPPCDHCVKHMIDGPMTRIFKSTDPHQWSNQWIGVCYLPDCIFDPKRNPRAFWLEHSQGGCIVIHGDDWPWIVDHMQMHAAYHLDNL